MGYHKQTKHKAQTGKNFAMLVRDIKHFSKIREPLHIISEKSKH